MTEKVTTLIRARTTTSGTPLQPQLFPMQGSRRQQAPSSSASSPVTRHDCLSRSAAPQRSVSVRGRVAPGSR